MRTDGRGADASRTEPPAADPAGHHRLAFAFSLAATLVAGVLMAFQSRMNGELARLTGQPVVAAWWSFGSGLVVIWALMALPRQRRALGATWRGVRERRLPWWLLVAGAFGGVLVGTQAAVVPLVGVAVFAVAVVAGQTAGGLLVDALGLGPAARQRVTWLRGLAAAGAFAGVLLAATASSAGNVHLGPALVAVVAGFLTSVQAAWNGRMTMVNGEALATTALNFTAGSVALACYGLVRLAGGSARLVPLHGPWWVWWGGLLGIVFVAAGAVIVRYLGVLLFTLVALVSQLVTALALDVLDPRVADAATTQRVAGLMLTAGAAGVAGWAAARARRQARHRG